MLQLIIVLLLLYTINTNQNEVKVSNNDLDEHAVPSLLIVGVAKGGSTDLWSLLTSVHPDFMCSSTKTSSSSSSSSKDNNNDKMCILEKEFNLYYVSGGYKDSKCPAQEMSHLMQCPENIARNKDMSRNITRCNEWLISDIGNSSKPKYTIDAYPMLMRDSCCESKLSSLLKLNDHNDNCIVKRKKKPKIIVLLRDSYNRTLSYYNYFTCRSNTISLEEMLTIEFNLFSKYPAKEYIDIITKIEYDNHHNDYKYANNIITAYHKLQLYMEKEILLIKQNYTNVNFERYGLLIDSIYLPQILSLLYPYDNNNNNRIIINWPILIIQSEYFFNDRATVLEENIIPFLHPNDTIRKNIKLPSRSEYMKQTGANHYNSRQGQYSNMSILSIEMRTKLSTFYSLLNDNLNLVLHRLAGRGKVQLAPPIKYHNGWWLNKTLE